MWTCLRASAAECAGFVLVGGALPLVAGRGRRRGESSLQVTLHERVFSTHNAERRDRPARPYSYLRTTPTDSQRSLGTSTRPAQMPGAAVQRPRAPPTVRASEARPSWLVVRWMFTRTAEVFVGSDPMPLACLRHRACGRPPCSRPRKHHSPVTHLLAAPTAIGAIRASLARPAPRREQAHSRDRLPTPPKL